MPIPKPASLQNAKIYKMTCGEHVYYGSTTNTLQNRFSEHKSRYNKYGCNGNRYSATKLFAYGTPKIELVEQVTCDNYKDLLARERFYIENNPCINHVVPGRTQKEYYQANRDKRLQQMRDNYYANKAIKKSLQQIAVN